MLSALSYWSQVTRNIHIQEAGIRDSRHKGPIFKKIIAQSDFQLKIMANRTYNLKLFDDLEMILKNQLSYNFFQNIDWITAETLRQLVDWQKVFCSKNAQGPASQGWTFSFYDINFFGFVRPKNIFEDVTLQFFLIKWLIQNHNL